jgi:hypothetical protein
MPVERESGEAGDSHSAEAEGLAQYALARSWICKVISSLSFSKFERCNAGLRVRAWPLAEGERSC